MYKLRTSRTLNYMKNKHLFAFAYLQGRARTERHHELLNLEISWLGFYKSYKLYSLGH